MRMPPVESTSRTLRTAPRLWRKSRLKGHGVVQAAMTTACPPFETRLRNSARGFAHEDRYEPFEEQFQPRGHPAPVGRCPDDEQVGAADRFAQLVRRIVRQRTDAGRAAAHTSRAGGDRRTVELGLDRFRSGLPGCRGRCVERLRDDPRGAGRCIEQQYVHRGDQPFSVISSS